MTYLVVCYKKGVLVTNGKKYNTERGAKIAAGRASRYANWYVMTEDEFSNTPVKMKKVKNLMTGVEIEIPENTPYCCDPSTETYWSM